MSMTRNPSLYLDYAPAPGRLFLTRWIRRMTKFAVVATLTSFVAFGVHRAWVAFCERASAAHGDPADCVVFASGAECERLNRDASRSYKFSRTSDGKRFAYRAMPISTQYLLSLGGIHVKSVGGLISSHVFQTPSRRQLLIALFQEGDRGSLRLVVRDPTVQASWSGVHPVIQHAVTSWNTTATMDYLSYERHHSVVVYAAQYDPEDRSHFYFDYTIDGHRGIIDAWVSDHPT